MAYYLYGSSMFRLMSHILSDLAMLRAAIFTTFILTVTAFVRWEERTLKCDVDDCQLAINDKNFRPADCTLDADSRHICDIHCEGADRDSVISKSPTTNRRCIRFYTYNTERTAVGWKMWRQGVCAKETIVLQVHCGFPADD